MIRIRYPDFSAGSRDLAGWHGSAERDARGVTVYLLPGLTGRQRQAVIRRLRQEASRGFGPALPLPALLVALALDRLRAATGTAVAILRMHPVFALLPGAVVAAMTLFMLASAGGAPAPASRTWPGGVLAGGGRSASVTSADLGRTVLGPTIAHGGSELGSGAPAPVWQARPHRRRHQPDRRRVRPAVGPARHDVRAGHRDDRRPRHPVRRDPRGCPGLPVGPIARQSGPIARQSGPRAGQASCRPAGS